MPALAATDFSQKKSQSPTRLSIFVTMRAWPVVLFAALASLQPVTAGPQDAELDLVFPLNDTYNIADSIPVVFAVQNADLFLSWEPYIAFYFMVNDTDKSTADASGAMASISRPPDIVNNMWWLSSSTEKSGSPFFNVTAGNYYMTWGLALNPCHERGGYFAGYSIVMQGSVNFTIVDDGSGKDMDITRDCPVYQGTLSGERNGNFSKRQLGYDLPPEIPTDCGNITRSFNSSAATPCRAKLWDEMAVCIKKNISSTYHAGIFPSNYDFKTCQKAIDSAPKEEDLDDQHGTASLYGVSTALLGLACIVALGL